MGKTPRMRKPHLALRLRLYQVISGYKEAHSNSVNA